jgi:hypothetical protein
MTDTPETDAMEYFDAMCDPDRVVEADFARKLERERNSWKTNYYILRQDIAEIREIIVKRGTADDVLKFLDTTKS